ncbi:Probable Zinc-ribbon domain-containing protein [Amycolatopsis lurida]|uniref:Treble clef zinc finger domain-containing protein n=2 Tax=Amycolatopsis lurida TaxID=31959 RepID=A0A2P2FFA3_AMYLU|nr:hypothetical protein BB31_41620 [Amycolatopsis lurida NRRL 2430]SEE29938.1 Probable Zinc-ribbon domain-containing protein [Amycolatopsis lurida]
MRRGGLEPLEPFTTPTAWRLTQCLTCGCIAHYRLEYTLEKNRTGEATCRACYWRSWATSSRAMQSAYALPTPTGPEHARQHAHEHGYRYLEQLDGLSLSGDPHRVQCVYCDRISALRLGDIGFGCSCQTNPRRERQTTNVSGPRTKDLLKDSGLRVLEWWDHDRNDQSAWDTATIRATRTAHWRCPDCELEFTSRVRDMVTAARCPDCEAKRRAEWKAQYARYQITPITEVPELLAAWDDEADPATVTVARGRLRKFRCPQGHHPRVSPLTYLDSGCPVCRGNETRQQQRDQAQVDPAAYRINRELAAQWHPEKNGKIRLATVSPNSRKNIWWRDPDCGHEWQESPARRDGGQRLRCPRCRSILDSLAFHYPEIAAEWAPTNPLTAWQVRPSGQTAFTPTWVCSTNPDHTWQATLASRASGSGCPQCRETGKSKVEIEHHAAAQAVFGNAASGQPVTSDAFTRRARWLVDITADLGDGRMIAIEYDGSYWHADKIDIDTAKSLDLLAAGYLVARLREHPLPPLRIDDTRYTEIVVYATAPDPVAVMTRLKAWTTPSRTPVDARSQAISTEHPT